MNEKMFEFLLKSLENTSQAVFLIETYEKYPFYANKQAIQLYCNEENTVLMNSIFTNKETIGQLISNTIDQLEKKDFALLYDISTTTNTGDIKICDMQVKYCDDAREILFIELFPKVDRRMERAVRQINQSHRAEGIFALDSGLTLVQCNELFYDVFEMTSELAKTHYNNQLSNGFLPDVRVSLLAEIHEKLQGTDHFTTKLKVITTKNEEKWYSLELQRRTLDDTGLDKILAYMENIESQVETEEQLDDINQYFSIIQDMFDGLLYRFDIKTRTLYRQEKMAKKYNMPIKTENFPTKDWLENRMPLEEQDAFITYMDQVSAGIEGSHETIFRSANGEFEYHKFRFQAIRNGDGSIKEMVGTAINVHHLKTAQNELDVLNQYFAVIQEESECMIYRYDGENRILYRNSILANKFGFPLQTPDYPSEAEIQRAAHPEDREKFRDFFHNLQKGIDSTLYARTISIDQNYEHHKLTGKAIRNSDGSIREMLLTTLNVHKKFSLEEKDKELKNLNQYFDSLQELSDDLLYRIDIPNKSLILREKKEGQGNLFSSNIVETNFPESARESGQIHPDDIKSYIEFGRNALKGLPSTTEVRMKSKQGEFGFRRIICVPVPSEDGIVKEMMGKVVDIQNVRNLEEMANYDGLTHTLNKRAMLEAASYTINTSSSTDKHALFFLDLDDFKYVNDNLGHAFGDFLLKELGRRLKESVRTRDLVGRVGGDEFVIFLHDAPSIEMLMGKAKMLLSSISEDVVEDEKRHSIHGSIGIALYPEHGKSYEELYHHADKALYESKRHGKNTVHIFKF